MAKRVRRNLAPEQSTSFQSFPLLHSRNARGISSAPKALRILKNSYPAARLSGNLFSKVPGSMGLGWVVRKVIRDNNGIGVSNKNSFSEIHDTLNKSATTLIQALTKIETLSCLKKSRPVMSSAFFWAMQKAKDLCNNRILKRSVEFHWNTPSSYVYAASKYRQTLKGHISNSRSAQKEKKEGRKKEALTITTLFDPADVRQQISAPHGGERSPSGQYRVWVMTVMFQTGVSIYI
ncbi:hypothetical protein CDAR_601991 [Caerostris darwini]|uniref:Uncharacterized protein n=1 Tax=Caerostris darwini TaxID=1538125 RepID=A0AAV4SII9_9ARAC|nr:hypothetical protein CDAR_601991 [Caerostris darwini]